MPVLTPLARYVITLCAAASVIFAWAVVATVGARDLAAVDWLPVLLLTVAVFIGEAVPLKVGGGSRILLTLTGGFGLALVLVAPLGVALVLDALCLLAIDLYHRRRRVAIFFNLALYTLTLAGASLTFRAVSGVPLLTDSASARQLLGLLLAAAAVLFINHVLGAIWDARSHRRPARLAEFRITAFKGLVYTMDLAYGPMSLAVLQYSPLLLPLVALPALTLHRSAVLAAKREHEAMHDVLTGLPNRALLNERFSQLTGNVERGSDQLAVLLIDLDRFKHINDTLGHQVGDLLLCEVAARLTSAVRTGDTVARLGGDEFAILAPLSSGAARVEAQEMAQRLVDVLRAPFDTAEVRIDVAGSVGLAVAPEDGLTSETLMSNADIALYVAKEQRGSWAAYDPALVEEGQQRLALLGELREGLETGQLELHFQPAVDLISDEVTGLEAFVRWQHPTRGLLGADEFMHVARETALQGPLAYEVIGLALSQCRRWLDAGQALRVSINLFAEQLHDEGSAERIGELLGRHGVPPHLLMLEVNESTVMQNLPGSLAVVRCLRGIGVAVAVDKYGSSHSSIAFLHQLRPTELKIDRSVLRAWEASRDDVVVSATIDLAHKLNARVIAVGLEAEEMRSRLVELGCDAAQGHVLCPPLPAGELDVWLSNRAISSAIRR